MTILDEVRQELEVRKEELEVRKEELEKEQEQDVVAGKIDALLLLVSPMLRMFTAAEYENEAYEHNMSCVEWNRQVSKTESYLRGYIGKRTPLPEYKPVNSKWVLKSDSVDFLKEMFSEDVDALHEDLVTWYPEAVKALELFDTAQGIAFVYEKNKVVILDCVTEDRLWTYEDIDYKTIKPRWEKTGVVEFFGTYADWQMRKFVEKQQEEEDVVPVGGIILDKSRPSRKWWRFGF